MLHAECNALSGAACNREGVRGDTKRRRAGESGQPAEHVWRGAGAVHAAGEDLGHCPRAAPGGLQVRGVPLAHGRAIPSRRNLERLQNALQWSTNGTLVPLESAEWDRLLVLAGHGMPRPANGPDARNRVELPDRCAVYAYQYEQRSFPTQWSRRIMEIERETQGGMHCMLYRPPTFMRPDSMTRMYEHWYDADTVEQYVQDLNERRRRWEQRVEEYEVRHIYSMPSGHLFALAALARAGGAARDRTRASPDAPGVAGPPLSKLLDRPRRSCHAVRRHHRRARGGAAPAARCQHGERRRLDDLRHGDVGTVSRRRRSRRRLTEPGASGRSSKIRPRFAPGLSGNWPRAIPSPTRARRRTAHARTDAPQICTVAAQPRCGPALSGWALALQSASETAPMGWLRSASGRLNSRPGIVPTAQRARGSLIAQLGTQHCYTRNVFMLQVRTILASLCKQKRQPSGLPRGRSDHAHEPLTCPACDGRGQHDAERLPAT